MIENSIWSENQVQLIMILLNIVYSGFYFKCPDNLEFTILYIFSISNT